MDYFLLIAVALLILGIIGSVAPAMPGVLLSAGGIFLYWWSTGYTEPGNFFIILTAVLSGFTVVLDWFSGAITAKAGGASSKTSVAAGVAGFFGFFLLGGPVGVFIAVGATVFLREYFRTGDLHQSKKAGIYSALGLLASTFMQVLVTFTLLVGFLLVVLL